MNELFCNQVIDVFLINKEALEVINNSTKLENYPEKFVNRINSVCGYCYNLFMNCDNYSENDVNELMIPLMSKILEYRNSYSDNTYAYKVMNSLLDIVIETFKNI